MRTSAAITLIICGTVLILTPHVLTTIGTGQVAHLIEVTQHPDASLNGGLSPLLQYLDRAHRHRDDHFWNHRRVQSQKLSACVRWTS